MVFGELRRFGSLVLTAIIVVGGVSAGVGVTPAAAAPVLFTDEAAFNAAVAGAGVGMRQDGFEGLASGYRAALDREGYTVRGTFANPQMSLFIDNQWATEGVNSLIFPNLPSVFEFDQPVRAFSVDLVDNFAFAPAAFGMSINGGPMQTLFDLPMHSLPRPRVIQFLGVFDADGIDSLVLTNFFHGAPNVSAANLRIDRFRYEDPTAATPVPEPGTMLLLGAGLLGSAAKLRKARR